jgi:hypothetical protein
MGMGSSCSGGRPPHKIIADGEEHIPATVNFPIRERYLFSGMGGLV